MASGFHGTAELLQKGGEDLSPLFEPEGCAGVPLGIDGEGSKTGILWSIREQRGHGLTIGRTRDGKKVCAINPALMTYGGSMVVISPKGEEVWETAERRRQMGQRVVILDPWGEVNRRYGSKAGVIEQIGTFNPLASFSPDDPDFEDDCRSIADALIIDKSSDPHWSESAGELVSGCTAAMVEALPGTATLSQVRKLITMPVTAMEGFIAKLIEEKPDSLGASKLGGFMGGKKREADDEIGGIAGDFPSIRSAARTQTAILDNQRLALSMETVDPAFDLAELATGKVTLYLVLPVDKLQTHGRWLRLILTLAIRAIARQDTPPDPPVLFMLDEMGTVGKLTAIEQAFGLMAGVGIRLWGFIQDLTQLKRDYPESWETFIANSSFVQVIGASDLTTSRYIQDLLGTRTVEEISVKTAKERQGSLLTAGDPTKTAMTDREFSVPLMYAEQLKYKLIGNALIMFSDGRNYLVPRIVYYKEARWRSFYRPNPLYEPVKFNVSNVEGARKFLVQEGWEFQSKGLMSRRWTATHPKHGAKEIPNDQALIELAQSQV